MPSPITLGPDEVPMDLTKAQRSLQPVMMMQSSGEKCPSSITLVQCHYSEIGQDVFMARSRDRITQRWCCNQRGYGTCFTSSSLHHCMSEGDIHDWAHELDVHEATLRHPPEWLLARWNEDDTKPSLSVVPETGNAYALKSSFWDSIASLCSESSDEQLEEESTGIGYTSGTVIKGLGNIIIGALAHVDTKYRDRQLRGLIKHLDRRERDARATAFHRTVLRLVSPSKQLNGLLSNILELGPNRASGYRGLLALGRTLETNSIEMNIFMRMKWLRITQVSGSGGPGDRGILHRLDQMFVEEDYDSDEEATNTVTQFLESIYRSQKRNGFASCEPKFKLTLRLLLSQTLDDASRGSNSRGPRWNNVLSVGQYINGGYESKVTPVEQLRQILDNLSTIHYWDEGLRIDAHPTSEYSVWRCACEDLGVWLKRNHTVHGWTAAYPMPDSIVTDIMTVMAKVHDARRRVLRDSNILEPLMEAVPDDVWEDATAHWIIRGAFPEVSRAAQPAAYCKELALRLAREF